MKIFIQLSQDGKRAHWKFRAESKPEFHPGIILIDVTGITPEPQENWLWDGKKFSPPPEPVPDPKQEAARNIAALHPKIIEATGLAILTGVKTELQTLMQQLQDEKAKMEA